MTTVQFTPHGCDDYVSWVDDRKATRRINRLVEEAARDPGTGSGKPERLRAELTGYWSRRIDQEHRLVYAHENDVLTIIQARGHY